MPLVSVIVPTFNRAHCVARALDSACKQTHRDLEVLVIDDGSSDGTADLIRTRYGSDPRVRYIRQDNQGVAAARNTGLRAARGAFIALLDSDDVWRPWKTELQLACLARHPRVGMVWSDMEAIDPAGLVTHPRYLRTMYSCWRHYPDPGSIFEGSEALASVAPALASEVAGTRFYTGEIFSHMIRGNMVHTSTVLLRRERVDEVGPFNEQLRPAGEDFDFHLRTCHAGPVGFLDAVTIQYQVGMEDRLTRPEHSLAFAASYLRTIEPFIAGHRAEIRLPDAELHAVLAEAHRWLAETHFSRGGRKDARRHLTVSLRHHPAQARAWMLLVASFLPARWIAALRSARAQS
jgi:GT2 family glycosyltransferase